MGNFYEKHDWKERWEDIEPYFIGGPYDGVLDIGCAGGDLGKHVSTLVKFVIGIDNQQDAINVARSEYNYKFTAYYKNINDYISEKWSYDIILCLGVIHKPKIIDPIKIIDTILQRAKKQVIFRDPVINQLMIETAHKYNFDVLCPAKSNVRKLIICNKI